ncbi:MAG: LacI family DNA-binding transcriptional regulator [Propioniciclava sp.]
MAGTVEPVPGDATIKDVAVRARVALSSVSRVFSGHPDVSAAMRAKVLRAAEELAYEPDPVAQALRQGRTTTVGFMLRDIANPLFADIAKRCEHDLRLAGYSMIIMSSDGYAEVEASNLSVLRRRRVDGVIASLVTEREAGTVSALHQLTAPIVLLDRDVEGLEAGCVLTDHYPGVLDATAALVTAGHERIAFVTGNVDVRSTRERLRAIRDAHDQASLALDPDLLCFEAFDTDWGYRSAIDLLSRSTPPTAILAGGVGPAQGIMRAMQERGLGINRDVVVVALDEWPNFDVLTPEMPSVQRDPATMGEVIAAEMLRLLDGGTPSSHLLPTVFKPRGHLRPPS